MGTKRDARALLVARIRSSPPKFVRIAGSVTHAQLEPAANPDELDHVWVTMTVPPFGRIRAAINTISRISRVSGFDARVRLGIVRSTWSELPAAGLSEIDGFSYETIESSANVFYEVFEQIALEEFLIERAQASVAAEVWGDLYARREIGIHRLYADTRHHQASVPRRVGET